MVFTIVRGGALLGTRLCEDCKDNYYQQDLKEKPKCAICGLVITEGIQVTLCRSCSLETCVCQSCGKELPVEEESRKKPGRRKKNEEPKIPLSVAVQQQPVEAGDIPKPDDKSKGSSSNLSLSSESPGPNDNTKLHDDRGKNAT